MTKTTLSTAITVLFIITDGFDLLRPFDLDLTFQNGEIWNQMTRFSTSESNYITSANLGDYVFAPVCLPVW